MRYAINEVKVVAGAGKDGGGCGPSLFSWCDPTPEICTPVVFSLDDLSDDHGFWV